MGPAAGVRWGPSHLGRGSEARGPAEKNPGKANRIVARSVDFRQLTRSRRGRGFGRSARRLGVLRCPHRGHRCPCRSARRLGVLSTRPGPFHSSPPVPALRSTSSSLPRCRPTRRPYRQKTVSSTSRQCRKPRVPARGASAPPVAPAGSLQPSWQSISGHAPGCASAANSTADRGWDRAASCARAARLVGSTRCSPGLRWRPSCSKIS